MTEQRRTQFTDLVRARRAELGYSLRELEARTVDGSGEAQVKFGWLSKLERGEPVLTPKENAVKLLAAALDLPERTVKAAAAAQFLGLDPRTDPDVVWSDDLTTRIIVAHAEEMSDEDRLRLAEIAETFARRRTQRKSTGQGNSDD
ncbi:XRE family transcriptional regulator [Streptomyces sp. NPDC017638]|uniref:XRE family transcriptional regulator n=1 Tax=Streptomyces sp. NPDC017638 TaxID=3365004 RepID=UPI0037B8ADDB